MCNRIECSPRSYPPTFCPPFSRNRSFALHQLPAACFFHLPPLVLDPLPHVCQRRPQQVARVSMGARDLCQRRKLRLNDSTMKAMKEMN